MAVIQENKLKDGSFSYRVQIRKSGHSEIYKTFHTKEDAEIYCFYKERLIDNIEAFEVPIEKRMTLNEIFELKLDASSKLDRKTVLDMENAYRLCDTYIDVKRYMYEITYKFHNVFRGAKTDNGKRKMSPVTLRRHFACYSSAFSHAIGLGFNIENLPLKILQNYINPILKEFKKENHVSTSI